MEGKFKDRSILFVDDEKHNLTAFRATFRRDFEIVTAQSAEDAMELLETRVFDLVISDQRMPKISGAELLSFVFDKHPETLRMVITGYSDMQAIVDAVNRGKIYHYISKPWKSEEVKLIIDQAFEYQDLQRSNARLLAEKEELELQAEKQQKEHLHAQLQNLKNQLKPHFLFNALSSLHILIDTDTELARTFVVRLSRLFRLLLDQQADQLVTVEQDWEFVDHYIFLQQIRFQSALIIDYKIPASFLKKRLVSASLQILTENALKHNILNKSLPLTISYTVEDDFLVVKNNYRPKQTEVASTHHGLENLKERYRLAVNKIPEVFIEEGVFIAKVPLIN
ncbi:MAG: histidine kinase [Bacteroidales bacterium]